MPYQNTHIQCQHQMLYVLGELSLTVSSLFCCSPLLRLATSSLRLRLSTSAECSRWLKSRKCCCREETSACKTHTQIRDQRSAAEGEPCLWVIQTENRPPGASPCPNRVSVCPCQACEDTKRAPHLIGQGDALGGG